MDAKSFLSSNLSYIWMTVCRIIQYIGYSVYKIEHLFMVAWMKIQLLKDAHKIFIPLEVFILYVCVVVCLLFVFSVLLMWIQLTSKIKFCYCSSLALRKQFWLFQRLQRSWDFVVFYFIFSDLHWCMMWISSASSKNRVFLVFKIS